MESGAVFRVMESALRSLVADLQSRIAFDLAVFGLEFLTLQLYRL